MQSPSYSCTKFLINHSSLQYVNMIAKNESILILAVAVLTGTTFIVSTGNSSYAQSNATNTVDPDAWIEALKAKHPTLAAIPDIADIEEDRDVVGKLKALDSNEAVRTLMALNIVRDLIQYKHALEVQ